MNKPDAISRNTVSELQGVETAMNTIYKSASTEAIAKGDAFFDTFKDEWDTNAAALAAGTLSLAAWMAWANKKFKSKHFKNLIADMATLIVSVDATSLQLINNTRFGILAYAHNYTGYTLTNNYKLSFSLMNAQTVALLQQGKSPILPVLSVQKRKTTKWVNDKIRREVAAGMLQGESVQKISRRLTNVTNMSKTAAIRNARTACTCAENTGRQTAYEEAAKQGLELKKRWLCTVDARTRSSHAHLDGELVPYNKPFSNGLRFPGDPQGRPEEVYNCRCTMVTVDPLGDSGLRRVGKDVKPHKTFKEYMEG